MNLLCNIFLVEMSVTKIYTTFSSARFWLIYILCLSLCLLVTHSSDRLSNSVHPQMVCNILCSVYNWNTQKNTQKIKYQKIRTS